VKHFPNSLNHAEYGPAGSRRIDGDLRGPQVSCAGAHESNRRFGRNTARVAKRLPQLLNEIVIFFVRADPKPNDQFAVTTRQSTVMIADSD